MRHEAARISFDDAESSRFPAIMGSESRMKMPLGGRLPAAELARPGVNQSSEVTSHSWPKFSYASCPPMA